MFIFCISWLGDDANLFPAARRKGAPGVGSPRWVCPPRGPPLQESLGIQICQWAPLRASVFLQLTSFNLSFVNFNMLSWCLDFFGSSVLM